jgi:hypothetical protein
LAVRVGLGGFSSRVCGFDAMHICDVSMDGFFFFFEAFLSEAGGLLIGGLLIGAGWVVARGWVVGRRWVVCSVLTMFVFCGCSTGFQVLYNGCT